MSLPTPLVPVSTSLDWLSFATTILPQWRQSLEFSGGIFGIQLAQNYFDAAANILPTMPPMIDPFDPLIHGNNDGNRTNRRLTESNYTQQSTFAQTVITAERSFRAGIISALEPHQLTAAIALTPTGATLGAPAVALHSIPAQDIIPALRALAITNAQYLIGSVIDDLSKPFVCTAPDSCDKFVHEFKKLIAVLSANNQTPPPHTLRTCFLAATNANFREVLSPYFAIASSSPNPDVNAYISAFLSAKPLFQEWLVLQTHAPAALSASAVNPVKPAQDTANDRKYYCRTHGHGFHSGAVCIDGKKNPLHKPAATAKNTMGGSTKIVPRNPDWKPTPRQK